MEVERILSLIVFGVMGALIFRSNRHKQADEAMARTIDAQRAEIDSLRRRLANGS